MSDEDIEALRMEIRYTGYDNGDICERTIAERHCAMMIKGTDVSTEERVEAHRMLDHALNQLKRDISE